MKVLVELPLQRAYRTSSHDLGRDFLAELLVASASYRRAVGYFASSVFSIGVESWRQFFEAGGRMRIVCSHSLVAEDIAALRRATFERPSVRREFQLDKFDFGRLTDWGKTSALLAGLAATDRLDVRIAVRPDAKGSDIYHEKIGIFGDAHGNLVAFTGSANETRSAYAANFERVDVFTNFSDQEQRRRTYSIERQFEELWSNETQGVRVYRIDDALRAGILFADKELSRQLPEPLCEGKRDDVASAPPEALHPASGIEPRAHQLAAIRAWAQAGGRGLLEMATGSGKTITALTLASRFYDAQGSPLAILVVAPLVHLVDQWRDVCQAFGLNPIRCAESMNAWQPELSAAIDAVNSGRRPVLSIVTTGATLTGEPLQRLIGSIRVPLMLIADEVHNYGASTTFQALPENAVARVGLSATPDRAYDDAGNARLQQYFGGTVFAYGLGDALHDGVLTPYRYYPEVVELEPDEIDQYVDLSMRIARYGGADDSPGQVSDTVKRLYIRRARVVAAAQRKLPRLRELLDDARSDTHILVYCGDGTIDGPDDGALVRQIDEARRIIGRDLGMRCATYTATTPPKRRKELLSLFAQGEVQVLIAIRCLDEGVDVPSTRQAYLLASTTNPRQFVQRRGRVLRRFPGKMRAEVFDLFVTFPPADYSPDAPQYKIARGLVRSQLRRVQEFADLAENGPAATSRLLELRDHFNLLSEG